MTLGNSQSWEIDNSASNPLTVSGSIGDGTFGYYLNKTGSGELILSGASTYSGGTIVSAGTLQLGVTNALLSTGALTVNGTGVFDPVSYTHLGATTVDGGTLELNNSSALSSGTLNFNAGAVTFGPTITTATLAGLSGGSNSQDLVLQNTAGSPAAVALTIAGSGSSSYGGELTGPGSFIKTGTGTQTFTGDSNFAGAVTLSGPVVIAGGTFGSTTSNFEVGNGVCLLYTSRCV